MRLSNGAVLGRYRIERPLGSGGMGEVYLTKDLQLLRSVAMKVLPPAQASDHRWLDRLHREARAAGRVNHPGILTIHEIGQCDGIDFIASEFIEGKTLREELSTRSIAMPMAIDIARQIAGALHVPPWCRCCAS